MIIDGGECEIGVESTIVKLLGDDSMQLLRPGKITKEQLEDVGRVVVAEAVTGELKPGQVVESPGMKYKHYAPKSQLILLKGNNKSRQNYILSQNKPCAVMCYTEELELFRETLGDNFVFDLGPEHDTLTHCRHLFKLLRLADLSGVEVIYAPLPIKEGIGLALYNRMIRAAAHYIIETEGG